MFGFLYKKQLSHIYFIEYYIKILYHQAWNKILERKLKKHSLKYRLVNQIVTNKLCHNIYTYIHLTLHKVDISLEKEFVWVEKGSEESTSSEASRVEDRVGKGR